ncbi:PucR family transcriptional regulator [Candidatus Formimonas warabiya]|uniref:PucR family transcriptional regulator n=1 Tax=Formimonas warabiya TaxID=1761012 RepID=A0A3G1KVP8_FORW1|nr:PucR family transcriptional regulator [Candidatus Formimonas warabiya]ATW26477.1 hypothetical protein DCMF_18520 [Candidatus Formimonas warabiya]
MSVTVKEALSTDILRNTKIIAGREGLDRQILHVAVMEVPDYIHYLKGNEFILSSGIALPQTVPEQIDFVKQLSERSVAALAIKSKRFMESIPQKMIDTANQYHLPLLELAPDVLYRDIMQTLFKKIIDRDTSLNLLKSASESIISGSDMKTMLNSFSELIRQKSIIMSVNGQILAKTAVNIFSQEVMEENIRESIKAMTEESKNEPVFTPAYEIYPLIIENHTEGYLILANKTTAGADKLISAKDRQTILKSFITSLALQLYSYKTLQNIQHNQNINFLEDILLGYLHSEAIAAQRAKAIGFPHSGLFQVAIVFAPAEDQNLLSHMQKIITQNTAAVNLSENIKMIAEIYHNNVVLLLHADPSDHINLHSAVCQIGGTIASLVKEDITVCAGEIKSRLINIHSSYNEAIETKALINRLPTKNRCNFFSDMGISRLLLDINDDQKLKSYIPNYLFTLLKYDQENNTRLMHTLDVLLENGNNKNETAQDLFIHVKTLQYRIDRIKAITGLNFKSGEQLYNTYLGIRIMRILNMIAEA